MEIPGDPLATKKHIAGNQETEKWIFLVTPFGFSIVSLMHAYVFLCFLRFSYDSALLYLCPSFVFLCFPLVLPSFAGFLRFVWFSFGFLWLPLVLLGFPLFFSGFACFPLFLRAQENQRKPKELRSAGWSLAGLRPTRRPNEGTPSKTKEQQAKPRKAQRKPKENQTKPKKKQAPPRKT